MSVWTRYDPETGEVDGWVTQEDEPIGGSFIATDDSPAKDEIYVIDGKVKKYTDAEKAAKKARPFGAKWDNKTMKVKDDRAPEKKAADEEFFIENKRMREMPSLQEFADAYFWEQNGNKEPMKAYLAKVKAVKQKHPKKGEVV